MQKLICFAKLLLLAHVLSAQCLSGNYIIESFNNAPNAFPDFQAAVDAMKQFGVCGPVHFTVREQFYQMQQPVVIPPIAGASAVNTITFEGDSTLFVFKGINFQANFDSVNNPALVIAGADYLKFKGLTFTTSAGRNCKAMDITGDATHLQFESCSFYPGVGGSWPDTLIYAVRIQGAGNDDIFFKNSSIGGGYVGLEIIGPPGGGCDNLVIEGCSIGGSYFAGIRAVRVNYPVIRKSELFSSNSTALYDIIRMLDCQQGGVIEKNRFLGNFDQVHANLLLDNCSGTPDKPWLVANNGFVSFTGHSLQIQQCSNVLVAYNSLTSFNSPMCLFRQQTSEIQFFNNIFDSGGAGYVFENQADLNFLKSDYNVLSDQAAQHPSGAITLLNDWQNFSGEDAHSFQKRLYFQSPFNFLISPPDADVNAHATPVASVTDDLYGNPRDPATPDIGAVEFNMTLNDAAVQNIQIFHGIVCSGSPIDVQMTLQNPGANAITALSVGVFVNSNSFATLNWNGSIPSGDPNQPYTINLGTLTGDGMDKTFLFRILTVNGLPDENPQNDTASAPVEAGMFGDISIGGINSPYPTIYSAVADMTGRGVCDDVRFWIETGYYAEKPIHIADIPKTQPDHKITFSSRNQDAASVVVLYNDYSPDKQVIVSNTSDVAFEHLTFRLRDEDAAVANFRLGNVNRFSLKHCRLESPEQNIQITDNIGTFTIRDCQMFAGHTAIFIQAGMAEEVVLERNYLTHNTPGTAADTLLQIFNCENLVLRENTFEGGFYFSENKTSLIEANRFYAAPGQTAHLWRCDDTRFINNLLSIPAGLQTTFNMGDTRFWHNTLVAADTFPALYYMGHPTLANQLELINNCIVQLGDTVAVSVIAPAITLHNNNFYAPGDTFFVYDTLAFTPAIPGDTLAVDTLELHVLPNFINDGTYRITDDPNLANAGFDLLDLVPADLDGDARDAAPDIGADEFTGYKADLSVTAIEDSAGPCHGLPFIRAKVTNLSGATVHRFVVQCRVADSLYTPVLWEGDLAVGQSTDWLVLGKYFFSGENLTVWVRAANDAVAQNDTLKQTAIPRPMGGTYTVGGVTPDFYNPAEATAALTKMGMCAPVTFSIRTGLYQGEILLGEVAGNSVDNFIRIRSEAEHRDSVRLTSFRASTYNRLLSLSGPDYVELRHLTLEAYRGFFVTSYALWFENGTQHLTLRDCRFNLGVISPGSLDEYTTVENNEFLDAGISVHSAGDYERGLVIRNNYFRPAEYSVFGGNVASNVAKQTDALIEKNHFGFIASLRLDSAGANVTVASNRFDNFSGALGFYRCKGTAQSPILVKNNMLFSKLNFTSTQYNMYVDESEHIRFWHNSFYFEPTDDAFYYHYSISMNGCSNIDLQNNLISVPGNGFAYNFKNCAAITCDYNNVFVKDNRVAILFDQNGSNYQTWNMNQWRAQFGYDLLSTLEEPRFIYQDTDFQGDLHLSPASINLIKSTNLLPGVTDDLDSETRPASEVCVGADEFNPGYVDVEDPPAIPGDVLTVFPNPGTGVFTARMQEAGTGVCIVTDALGRVCLIQNFSEKSDVEISLPSAATGLFWVNIRTERGVYAKKVVVTGE